MGPNIRQVAHHIPQAPKKSLILIRNAPPFAKRNNIRIPHLAKVAAGQTRVQVMLNLKMEPAKEPFVPPERLNVASGGYLLHEPIVVFLCRVLHWPFPMTQHELDVKE